MAVPLLDLTGQYKQIGNELEAAVVGVLASGRYVFGPVLESFEHNIARYCDAKAALGVASGTDALILSLKACGVGPGDEVITTAFTFFATAEAVSNIGAVPVFVDIDPVTYNMDPSKVPQKITPKTKALMPVHLYGQCADMDALNTLAKKYDMVVIEDACQAIGARYKGKRAGALGDTGAFSFFPSKNLGAAGDGGLITTIREDLVETIAMLRVHGSKQRYFHHFLGFNSRLDPIQAALLDVKLKYLDDWNEKRRENAAYYNQLLGDLKGVEIPVEKDYNYHIYHQYTIRVKGLRDRVIKALEENQIGCSIYYPLPVHRQEPYAYLGYGPGSLPETEKAAAEVISLPIYPELTHSQQDEVCDVIRQVVTKAAR
ncbi:DegT/DnrJ/EryC1/StrS family aminotransferase [bacterium]|nr:DegT/DnrJ/EryC1/StrS family aminotransferase [bacterium]